MIKFICCKKEQISNNTVFETIDLAGAERYELRFYQIDHPENILIMLVEKEVSIKYKVDDEYSFTI